MSYRTPFPSGESGSIRPLEMEELSPQCPPHIRAKSGGSFNREQVGGKAVEDVKFSAMGSPTLEETIKEARVQAENILTEARRHSLDVEKEAYNLGFEQGEKAGMELASQKLAPLVTDFANFLEDLGRLRERIVEEAEKEVVKLAVAIAGKIILCEVSLREEVLSEIVRNALKETADKDEIKVLVNPVDLKFMLRCKEDLLSVAEGRNNLVIEGDGSVQRGGCIIETKFGEIDARVDQRMKLIEERLYSEFDRVSHPEEGEAPVEEADPHR